MRSFVTGWIAILSMLLLPSLGGCGDLDDEGPLEAEGGAGGDSSNSPSIGEIVWEECPYYGYPFECANIEVPLDWSDPESVRINTFVRRIRSPFGASHGQMWHLVGGPGRSVGNFWYWALSYVSLGWDVYLPDYRGVGASTSLTCGPTNVRQFDYQCMDELLRRTGEDLKHFSTYGAAMDIGKTIEAVREDPEERVILHGSSYGTFLANRILHLFPEQIDGAILGGVCPGDRCDLLFSRNLSQLAENVFNACGEDPACREKMGPKPWERLLEVAEMVENGHCRELVGDYGTAYLSVLMRETVKERGLLPVAFALVHRMERCDEEDVEAIEYFLRQRVHAHLPADIFADASSPYLQTQIFVSEMWEPELSVQEFREIVESQPLPLSGDLLLAEMKEKWSWPLYDTPEELVSWAPTTAPLLIINGDIDYQTPIWNLEGIEEIYTAPGQHFVKMPYSGHSAHMSDCGMRLQEAFLEDPMAPLDLRCVQALQNVDLVGTPQLAVQAFGVQDLWDNDD